MRSEEVQILIQELLNNKKKVQGSAAKNYKVFLKDHPELKGQVTIRDFSETLAKDENVQVFKKLPRPKEFAPIFSKNANSFQLDIVYMDDLGYTRYPYGLTAEDVNSRQAYVYPLRNKSINEVEIKINEFLNDVQEKTHAPVHSITTDLGSEFNRLPEWLEHQNIEVYKVNQGDKTKMGKIERFHRTLREKFKLILPKSNAKDWTEELDNVMANYNEISDHRALGHAPDEYNEDDFKKQYINYKDKYQRLVGPEKDIKLSRDKDHTVRIRSSALEKAPNPFKKGTFDTPMSKEVFNMAHVFPSGTVSLFKPGMGWKDVSEKGDLTHAVLSDAAGPKRFKPYDIMNVKKLDKDGVPLNANFFNKVRVHRKKQSDGRKLKKAGVSQSNVQKSKRIRVRKSYKDYKV